MTWLNSPNSVTLSDNEAHIWRADLDVDESGTNSFLKLLSADEKKRADKFRFKKDAMRFICGRGILRSLIGEYLERDPKEISFHYSEYGKPSIEGDDPLQFNVSHSQNIALFGLTKSLNIGVDVEFLDSRIESKEIAARFFSKNEFSSLSALPEQEQPLGFFNCWTRKEAFIKAVGEGLSFPLDKFEVSLEPNKPARLLATDWDPEDVLKWSVYSLPLGPNFVGSVVIEGFVDQLKCWNWENDSYLIPKVFDA